MTVLPPLAAELLAQCEFPKDRGPLACAVSGGADSVCLMILGVAAGCEVTAFHVDHQIRTGSHSEADLVEQVASQLGARFVSLRVHVEEGPNLEARAREARYGVLPEDCATGHTADDQAETILINLIRGAGIDGLAGMRIGPRHPILRLRREQTVQLVQATGLSFFSDPTNSDPRFTRNRIRNEVIPLLNEITRRDVVPILARQSGVLSDEADFLDVLANALDNRDVRELSAAPVPLARRALRSFAKEVSTTPYAPGAAAIERLLEVVRGERRASELPGGRRVSRSKGQLQVDP